MDGVKGNLMAATILVIVVVAWPFQQVGKAFKKLRGKPKDK